MGQLRDALLAANGDPAQLSLVKQQAIAALASLAGQSWSNATFTATITAGPSIDLSRGVVAVTVAITRITTGRVVWQDELTFGPLARIPHLVPDPAGDVSITAKLPDGTTVVRTYRDDIRAALIAAARDAIRISKGVG